MRKTKLLTATALSVILSAAAVAAAGQANAATSISTATTAPLKTSTSGDITVTSAGSITLTSGTAITVDSDNKVSLGGAIDMSKSADGSTGILITDVAGRTASDLSVSASITVTDDFTASDTKNSDGILEAPYTDAKTRYGIRSTGTTPFNGNVSIDSGSTITVHGVNARGVVFENKVNGTFTFDGTASVAGVNSVAVDLQKGATGNVYLSGSASMVGADASAVRLNGDYDGNIIIDGTYTSTGYATVGSLTTSQLAAVMATPEDLQQSGALIDIQASTIAKGLRIGTSQADNVDTNTDTSIDSNPDEDGNGIKDTNQSAASLTNYGAKPVLQIASADHDINIHSVEFASTAVSPPTTHYGIMIDGSITGASVYSGFDQTAVKLGGAGHAVNVDAGIYTGGAISSSTYGGNALALSMAYGANTPLIDVDGSIRASGTSATTSTTTSGTTTYNTVTASATAINIALGATVPTINVTSSGDVIATGSGSTTSATAIRDQSDTLTTITNKNIIAATISASDDNGDGTSEAVVNTAIAIDTHTNTHGLTLTQTDTALTDDDIAAPYIIGSILLGSGDDSISSSGGSISGNIDFGAGSNSFTLTNDAAYLGKITGIGTVNIDIAKGNMALTKGTSINIGTLHVGSESELTETLTTATPSAAPLIASGNAVFDNGAKLNLTLDKVITSPETFVIMKAANIDLGTMTTTTLQGDVPYIYHADLSLNTAKTQLDAAFRLKSQSEAGFSDNEYAAFIPVLTALSADTTAQSALVGSTEKATFDAIYEQYLPDYSGENMLGLALGSQSLNRSLSSLTLIPNNDGGQYWLQEYGYRTTRKHGDTAGFKSTSFSFAGGRETKLSDNNMVGVYVSFTSGSPLDNYAIAKEDYTNSDLTIGGYWRVRKGAFKGWAHAGGGFTSFESTRQLLTSNVNHVAHAKWNGVSYSAGAGASVDYKAGWLGVTPQVFADLYGLNENSHQETIVGTDTTGENAFALAIGKRDGQLLSTTAMLNFSYTRMFVKPEMWFGWRQNIAGNIPDTVANFKNGTPFTLTGGDVKGGGPIAGFRVSADNEWSYFSVEGSYEKQDAYTNYSMALRTRFQF